ncbi:MAG: TatD family hydrolase [Kofleriaceae bacterium]|nr:TatD family hydrolase [Kofleriaceae bacterium]
MTAPAVALIDSHCHLDRPELAGDLAAVLARAGAAGVAGMIAPGVRPATWAALAALPAAHPGAGLAIALGVHPQCVPALDAAERATVDDLEAALIAAVAAARAAGAPVAAIGECGLDGATADRDGQVRIFRAHVRAARALALPLIVHVVRAHDVAPRLLRDERAGEVGGVLHSYGGPPELIATYAALGMAFSFAGPVTWPGARRPVAAARAVPLELLLAETDAPDQAPAPHRGAPSEPAMVVDVVAGLAAARGADPAAIAAATAGNALRIFGDGQRLGRDVERPLP